MVSHLNDWWKTLKIMNLETLSAYTRISVCGQLKCWLMRTNFNIRKHVKLWKLLFWKYKRLKFIYRRNREDLRYKEEACFRPGLFLCGPMFESPQVPVLDIQDKRPNSHSSNLRASHLLNWMYVTYKLMEHHLTDPSPGPKTWRKIIIFTVMFYNVISVKRTYSFSLHYQKN